MICNGREKSSLFNLCNDGRSFHQEGNLKDLYLREVKTFSENNLLFKQSGANFSYSLLKLLIHTKESQGIENTTVLYVRGESNTVVSNIFLSHDINHTEH